MGGKKILPWELTNIADQFLQQQYGIPLSIPIVRNNRLRSTHGRFVMKKDGTPLRIELAGYTLDYGSMETILGILKHECIHYALWMLGQPSNDGHPYFESELQKHGAPSTNTLVIGKHYIFTCNTCGKEYESRKKKIVQNPSKYRTKCCNGTFSLNGERIYDGSSIDRK